MKIAKVAVDVLRVPVEHPYLAGGRTVDANWHVLARVTTSDGVEGIGYIVYPRPDLMTAIGHAARELGEHLIGMSVLEPEAAWDRLARRGDWAGPGGLLHCALAPLDIAVWDAGGKTLGQPLSPAPRRVSRPAPDVRERRPLVQPVARRARGLGEAPRRERLRRREAAARPGGDPGAGGAARAGRARGRRPGCADHGRHQ